MYCNDFNFFKLITSSKKKSIRAVLHCFLQIFFAVLNSALKATMYK